VLGPAKVSVTFVLGLGDRKNRGRISIGGKNFTLRWHVDTGSGGRGGGHPACYIISIGDSFLGTGHEGDQSPPSSAEFKETENH
jgi:hypothetical protein